MFKVFQKPQWRSKRRTVGSWLLLTLSKTKTRTMFLISRPKALLALLQKFLPCTAHIMYAFLLINFKNFSRHQKKHFRQHIIALVKALSYFFNLRSKYSKKTRIIRHIAMIRDPKASVPRWYLKHN